jgi:branched-subunit amino acid aminotransferase/4-amino-4-deoxychorismate lyase
MVYTLLSKVGALLKDPKAVKILEQYVPGITKNPMIALAKGMTLESLLALPQAKQAGITKEMVNKVLTEINGKK